MTTIEKSAQLRRVILAGLGAAALWTASVANAATAPSMTSTLKLPLAALESRVMPDALPLGASPLAEPLLVAPCGGHRCQRPQSTAPQTMPEPLLVAPCGGHSCVYWTLTWR
ncbi:MAG TPA: hypothetical protein VIY30_00500 [Burkholderiaceae bacterium]